MTHEESIPQSDEGHSNYWMEEGGGEREKAYEHIEIFYKICNKSHQMRKGGSWRFWWF